MRKILALLFSFLFVINAFSQTSLRGNIEVQINGVHVEEGGKLMVILYDSEETWLEIGKAVDKISESALKDTMLLSFKDYPYSNIYAIGVVHDYNDNDELDMRKLPYPKPKEGMGVSNNTYRMGPPLYEKAQVILDKELVRIVIEMRY